MKPAKKILLRAHTFKWWTPEVADVVEKYGSNIAWFCSKPTPTILQIDARFGGQVIAHQIPLLIIESARMDMIAYTMRKMADQLRAPAPA